MLTRADDLAKLKVLDETDRAIELGTLWRDRPAVIVFLRHFGCLHCREHVAQLIADATRIREAGAELSVVGNGSPSFIAGFREQTGWTGPLYTDPSLAVYRAAQLERSVGSTLDPRSLTAAWKALRHGTRQGRTQGDQWQQGGTLVVTPAGDVRWHHASRRPGDNATGAQIVAALR